MKRVVLAVILGSLALPAPAVARPHRHHRQARHCVAHHRCTVRPRHAALAAPAAAPRVPPSTPGAPVSAVSPTPSVAALPAAPPAPEDIDPKTEQQEIEEQLHAEGERPEGPVSIEQTGEESVTPA